MYSCICMVSSIYDPYLELLFSKNWKEKLLLGITVSTILNISNLTFFDYSDISGAFFFFIIVQLLNQGVNALRVYLLLYLIARRILSLSSLGFTVFLKPDDDYLHNWVKNLINWQMFTSSGTFGKITSTAKLFLF